MPTPVPYTDYDRDVIERTSWRLHSALQLSPTVLGGPVQGEALPLVTRINQIHATVTANAQVLARIRDHLGIPAD